ncbi:MAG: hypothetical protein KDJ52_07250 [Anaerolineae bacterium]|nr:hypothetical protein [Anaerolineae bacterium]
MNPTKTLLSPAKPMLKVKTHLKAGQGVCPDPGKAYSDGYSAGYGESSSKGSKKGSHHDDDHHHKHHDDWWW